ncbi:hypothetical protein [Streptomyces mirabilis]|uniref:hypothetical protein n=1 Tax=Streptomyces mirabilis TaxID=68239 RepID=UPI0033A8D8F0
MVREFFGAHTAAELLAGLDYALGDQERLTAPVAFDEATDKYVPVSLLDAFNIVGQDPRPGLPTLAPDPRPGRLSEARTGLVAAISAKPTTADAGCSFTGSVRSGAEASATASAGSTW